MIYGGIMVDISIVNGCEWELYAPIFEWVDTTVSGYIRDIIYSYGHLPIITGYKWDYTFYKWGYKYL